MFMCMCHAEHIFGHLNRTHSPESERKGKKVHPKKDKLWTRNDNCQQIKRLKISISGRDSLRYCIKSIAKPHIISTAYAKRYNK